MEYFKRHPLVGEIKLTIIVFEVDENWHVELWHEDVKRA